MSLDRYVDARSPKALLGARLEILGAALLFIALAPWAARDFIPDLATTRVVATAVLRGASRAGRFAAIATPFLLLLLAVTPASVIVSLWLTRSPNRRRSRR